MFKVRFSLLIMFFTLATSVLWGQGEIPQLMEALDEADGREAVEISLTLADLLMKSNRLDEASDVLEEAEELSKENGWNQLLALNLNQQGQIAIAQSKLTKAKRLFKKSNGLIQNTENEVLYLENLLSQIQVAQLYGNRKEEVRLQQILNLSIRKGNPESLPESPKKGAFAHTEFTELFDEAESLSDSLQTLSKENLALANRVDAQEKELSKLSEEQMRQRIELAQQRILLDSLSIKSLQDSINITRQEAELDLKASQQNILLVAGAGIFVVLLGLFWRYQGIRRFNSLLKEEKERSDELLLNILPATIADELKTEGVSKARKYEEVTVLFSDFKDFSIKSREYSPQQLVEGLDYCFTAFDQIVTEYGLEKIKTIGDAYVCAGGLPTPDPDHPRRVILAATAMQNFLNEWKLARQSEHGLYFEARIGIHTGPLVAGVVGSKKFAYDIWGETVNIAARMEHSSEPGQVNISGSTYQLIKDDFHCNYRGKVPIKNMGEIDMYFLEIMPHPSEGPASELPQTSAG